MERVTRRVFLQVPVLRRVVPTRQIAPPVHTYRIGSFESVVAYEEGEGCVVYKRYVSWYDPVEKEQRSKLEKEVFIVDAGTM